MINKIHFGKRVSMFRRKKGLSQAELAEYLGVTAQAVSKWECGNAIPDIDLLLELSHLFKVMINDLIEDVDLLYQVTGCETGTSKIAYFVPQQERPYNIEWANEIRNENWIQRNWEHTRKTNPSMDKLHPVKELSWKLAQALEAALCHMYSKQTPTLQLS